MTSGNTIAPVTTAISMMLGKTETITVELPLPGSFSLCLVNLCPNYTPERTEMSGEQELKAIFQIHSIPEQAQKELRELFKKSNRDARNEGWSEGHHDGLYESTYE